MEKTRSLQWWKDVIKSGLEFQERYAGSTLWPMYKAYYRHQFPKQQLPVNLVFSILRSMVPQVYFRNPKVVITPTRPGKEWEFCARLLEDMDNWLLTMMMTKYEMKKMVNDAFLCGISSGFIGYDSQFGLSQKNLEEGLGNVSLTNFDKKGNRIETNSIVQPGMPWFLRARPEDTIYPWGCESKESAEWVAMRVFRPVEDVKADRKYKNTEKLKGSFTKVRTTANASRQEVFEEMSDHEWVELFEIHDYREKKVITITMEHDEFLRDEEDLLQFKGLPCETLVFNPDPDYIYGIPDTRIIEPQMLELIEIRTQAMKHRRVDMLKFLMKKGAMTKEEVDKLFSENVAAAAEVDVDVPLNQAIQPFTPAASGILADLERMGEVIRSDVREMVGFSRSSTGEYQGKSHISAKETEIVSWANQIRIDERRDLVSDMLTNIVRKVNQIIFTYWNQPMVRQIVGPEGGRWWLQFTPTDIKAEYNIEVNPTNAVPVDQRTKRQEAFDMAQAWAQMNQGMAKSGQPAPAELQRYFFSQFDGVNIEKLLNEVGMQGAMNMAMQGMPPGAGPGQNPEQAVPPQVAAQMLQQRGGGA